MTAAMTAALPRDAPMYFNVTCHTTDHRPLKYFKGSMLRMQCRGPSVAAALRLLLCSGRGRFVLRLALRAFSLSSC